VDETFASGGLNARAQLLGKLQGGGGTFCLLAQFHASKVLRFFAGRGSVIHTSACVMVTNHTSGLEHDTSIILKYRNLTKDLKSALAACSSKH
jgi:hypothetical protein